MKQDFGAPTLAGPTQSYQRSGPPSNTTPQKLTINDSSLTILHSYQKFATTKTPLTLFTSMGVLLLINKQVQYCLFKMLSGNM